MNKLPLLTWALIAAASYMLLNFVVAPVPAGCFVAHYYEFPHIVCPK